MKQEEKVKKENQTVELAVEPGICGFPGSIQAEKLEKWSARVTVHSDCKHIRRLNESLVEVTVKELFSPLSANPVFRSAQKAGCHPSCPYPVAVVKALEVAMGMALPKQAKIEFENGSEREEAKCVPFKSQGGVSRELIERLLEKGKSSGIEEIHPFSPEEIVVARWVHMKCRYGCSQYNKSWCCPPATPGPEKLRELLSEYSQALLLVGTQSCPDFYRDSDKKRAMQVRCWKGTVSLERMLFLEGYYKAFSLVGEACALCKECAYPEDCHFPQEKRPSLQALSIDVVATLEKLGITPKIALQTDEPFSYYAIILIE